MAIQGESKYEQLEMIEVGGLVWTAENPNPLTLFGGLDMLSTRWTPVLPASFNSVRREFEEAFNRISNGNGSPNTTTYLPLTIWDDDAHIYLEVDLPGFNTDSLEISYQDGQLNIAAERTVPKDDGRYWHNERMFGRFSRSVALPDVVDPEGIEAEMEDGVLKITVAKKPEAQPTKIAVKCGNGKKKRLSHDKS